MQSKFLKKSDSAATFNFRLIVKESKFWRLVTQKLSAHVQTGSGKSPRKSVFSRTIASSQKPSLDCGQCDTNESPNNFCEKLIGAHTEFSLKIDAQTLPKEV